MRSVAVNDVAYVRCMALWAFGILQMLFRQKLNFFLLIFIIFFNLRLFTYFLAASYDVYRLLPVAILV